MALESSTFKTFPDFSKLTIGDKEKYENLIAEYPPISDLSFTSLMFWWNFLDSCAVSQLNGNLIISYWFPGIEKYSGLSLTGTHKIDESICTIFDHLRERGDKPRLVHVPEFVIRNIHYPELFIFKEERGFDEYIVPVSRLYPLENVVLHRRRRIKRFLADINEDSIGLRSLDLGLSANQLLLLDASKEWRQQNKKGINNLFQLEEEAMQNTLWNTDALDVENICFYVDGELQAFCVYHISIDGRYAEICHVKLNDTIPRFLDYISYALARYFAGQGVVYVNLQYDLGLPLLRMIKLSLGPTNYFRKYTVRPVL